MLSLLGAIASAPTDCVSVSSVRDVQVWVASLYVHTPPCAAPRMIEPSLRTARAPMRPATAWNALDVRPFCTIGSGPTLVHAPPRVAPGCVSALILPAWVDALARSVAACSRDSPPSSPASSRDQ